MIEPPVCVPKARGTIPAATAAADPEEEPPGVWRRLCGFRVLVGSRWAKAVVAVFPMIVAPARFARLTSGASAFGRQPE